LLIQDEEKWEKIGRGMFLSRGAMFSQNVLEKSQNSNVVLFGVEVIFWSVQRPNWWAVLVWYCLL